MFAKVSPLSLFATPLYGRSLTDAAYNATLLNAVAAMADQGVLSGRRPWRSAPDLARLPAFRPFADLLEATGAEILGQLQVQDARLVLTGLWAQVEPPGTAGPAGQQPNAYLTALYLASGEPGEFRLLDPRPQVAQILPAVTQPGPLTATEATLPLHPGRLLLFPAWLTAAVPPHRGRAPRVLLRATLLFDDFAHRMSPPRWTGLTEPVA